MIAILDDSVIGDITERRWRPFLRYREKRTPLQWAQAERWIGQGASPLSVLGAIRYDVDVMPWCREPMEQVVAREVQITVLMWASGMAKTEVVANMIGQSIDEEPKNIFVAYPKDGSRDKFSRDVIDRMIESTPALTKCVSAKKSRDAGNTIAYKRYPGGSIYMVGAGSASNFRGPRAGLIYCDEIDNFPENLDGEGDPVSLAFRRAEGFANAIKILSGTPTIKKTILPTGETQYHSRIEYWFDQSDQRKWFVPCRSCGHRQVLLFDRITRLKDKPWRSYITCEKCDTAHDDKQRLKMIMEGEWRATATFTGIRGYWLNGLNATLPAEKGYRNKLHQLVVEEARAEKDPNAKRVFVMTVKAECVDPEEQGEPPPAWKPLFDRREDYGLIVPAKGLVLTASVDLHLERLEVLWRVWGWNEESWGLDHIVLDGHVRHPEVWQALRSELARKFQHAFGCEIQLSMCFVDGGKYWEDAYRFFQRLARDPMPGVSGHVRASKGFGQQGHPIVAQKFMTVAKNLRGHHIGTWEAKDRIYERLRMEPVENDIREGVMHFNKQFSEEYFQQLTAETVLVTYERGVEVRKYVNPKDVRNEALDLEVGCLAALRLHPRNLDAIELGLKARANESKQVKDEATTRPRRARMVLPRAPSEFGIGWRV